VKKYKILYIVPHRMGRSPGQRFRCEHFIPYLKDNGFDITYSNLLSETDDHYFYSFGNLHRKIWIVVKSFFKRLKDVWFCKKYDLVFIYREAHMLGTTIIERMFRLRNVPIIFDFDDSIWLNDTSPGNQKLKWLKRPSKTADICRLASTVIVGNQYLADYAKRYNPRVEIVPTTIDTDYHVALPHNKPHKTAITIGWTGTSTTLKHFYTIVPVLKSLHDKYGNKVDFLVIADLEPKVDGLPLKFFRWNPKQEIEQLAEIDIGIMPLPDNEWTRGKCGFKGLQYMALKIPTIMSPVGVNKDIVDHGLNGFLADSEEDWFEYLSQLIDNEELRKRIGMNGRQRVLQHYSVKANREKYLSIFKETIEYHRQSRK